MNGHAAADKDEANCGMHHSLREQMGQLVDRERVLYSENDQLRAQLVEMKEQEKKKYDDLMVQYRELMTNANIKQEAEDDGLDSDGTSNNTNQVTGTTESKDEVVKVEIKEEEDDEEDRDIHIKQEYVHEYIKTESNDFEVKKEIKQEIKEEYEDDNDDDCDRCVVKKELLSDDDEQVDNEGGLIRGGEHNEIDAERYEVTQPNLDNGQLINNPAPDIASASNSFESIFEGVANLWHEQQTNNNTLNEPNSVTRVTQSADLFSLSTSTGQDSIRTDLTQQATVSTHRNGTKRKQTRPDRTVKRSKKTLQHGDGEDGEDIANEDREDGNDTKRKQSSANRTVKRSGQEPIGEEIATESTTNPTQPNLAQPNRRFQCSHCSKSFDRNFNLQRHLRVHTGELPFHCDMCDQRFSDKSNLARHQQIHQNIKNFPCPECDQRFTQKSSLESHLRTHTGDRPFACRHCEMSFAQPNTRHNHEQAIHLHVKSYRCKQCGLTATHQSIIITHIRMVHFGLPQTIKQQHELNIVDDRDPRELIEKV